MSLLIVKVFYVCFHTAEVYMILVIHLCEKFIIVFKVTLISK